jgi:anti-sigma factor RsiW
MSCTLSEWLDGYFDGELDAARAAEFEAHLAGCAACTEALGRHRALRDSIAGASLYAPAGASLRGRIRRALPGRHASPGVLAWLVPAAAVVVVVAGLWAVALSRRAPTAERVVLASVLDAHVRSLQPGHLTDVLSSDRHTVKPWFDGRLDFSPPVADLAPDGFPLTGGRLDVVAGRSVAALVYARRRHAIGVFVWPTEGAGAAVRAGSANGYQWVHWTRAGMSFWAVSDVSAEDLAEFARLLQRLAPAT